GSPARTPGPGRTRARALPRGPAIPGRKSRRPARRRAPRSPSCSRVLLAFDSSPSRLLGSPAGGGQAQGLERGRGAAGPVVLPGAGAGPLAKIGGAGQVSRGVEAGGEFRGARGGRDFGDPLAFRDRRSDHGQRRGEVLVELDRGSVESFGADA